MQFVYLWILVAVMAVFAGVFVWLERRHENALKDHLRSPAPSEPIELLASMRDTDWPVEDTAPAVLEPSSQERPSRSSGRRR